MLYVNKAGKNLKTQNNDLLFDRMQMSFPRWTLASPCASVKGLT